MLWPEFQSITAGLLRFQTAHVVMDVQGTEDSPGVNMRALSALFDMAKARQNICTYQISVSLMEIYNETIRCVCTYQISVSHVKVHNKTIRCVL